MTDLTTSEGLRAAGFEGFVAVSALRQSGLAAIPDRPGVYVVLRRATEGPRFLRASPAGQPGGRDPSVPPTDLEGHWLLDAEILYVAQAGGRGLCHRIGQFLDFGRGMKTAHWGGRLVWQLAGSGALELCWQAVPGRSPWGRKNALLSAFQARHGTLPFANARL